MSPNNPPIPRSRSTRLSPERSRATLVGLSAMHAVDDLYQGAVPALIPFFVLSRHYSYAAGAGIVLAANLLSSILQPLFGVWTDRRPHWWLIPAGVALAGLGFSLSGAFRPYWLTWTVIAVMGIGVSAFHPQASLEARTAAGDSARRMSIFSVGGNVGFVIGPILVPIVLGAAGVTGTLWMIIPALAASGIFAIAHRNRAGLTSPGPAGIRRPASAVAPVDPAPAQTDDWHSFGWLIAAITIRAIVFSSLTSFVALFFIRRLHAGSGAGSAALVVFLACGLVGTVLGGGLADRIGRIRVLMIGYGVFTAGLLVLDIAPDPAIGFLGVAISGIGAYLPFSVQVTLGQEYLPNRVGTASGATLGLAMTIGGVFAPLIGALADHAGLTVAFTVMAIIPLISLAIVSRLSDPSPHIESLRPEP